MSSLAENYRIASHRQPIDHPKTELGGTLKVDPKLGVAAVVSTSPQSFTRRDRAGVGDPSHSPWLCEFILQIIGI
jgi:hypothetical protein